MKNKKFSADEVFKNYPENVSLTNRKLGFESEYPVVNIHTGEAIDYETIRFLFRHLIGQGWSEEKDLENNETVFVYRYSGPYKEVIGTDVGFATLEISLAPTDNLVEFEKILGDFISTIVSILKEKDAMILGYGIHPVTKPSQFLIANKARYKIFVQNALNRYVASHDGNDQHLFTVSSSNQCHLDVNKSELVDAINVFNKISPFAIAIFQNSPIWKGRLSQNWRALREMIWDWAWSNRIEQVAIPKEFDSLNDYIETILNFKPLMIKRENRYYEVKDYLQFRDFLSEEKAEVYNLSGESSLVEPLIEDLIHHNSFAWFNARPSPHFNTIEFRPICQQLPEDNLSVSAFALGIISNLNEVKKYLEFINMKEAYNLRFETCRSGLSTNWNLINVLETSRHLMKLAENGLKKRNKGEEKFLFSTMQRLEKKISPADLVIDHFKKGGVKQVIKFTSFK